MTSHLHKKSRRLLSERLAAVAEQDGLSLSLRVGTGNYPPLYQIFLNHQTASSRVVGTVRGRGKARAHWAGNAEKR